MFFLENFHRSKSFSHFRDKYFPLGTHWCGKMFFYHTNMQWATKLTRKRVIWNGFKFELQPLLANYRCKSLATAEWFQNAQNRRSFFPTNFRAIQTFFKIGLSIGIRYILYAIKFNRILDAVESLEQPFIAWKLMILICVSSDFCCSGRSVPHANSTHFGIVSQFNRKHCKLNGFSVSIEATVLNLRHRQRRRKVIFVPHIFHSVN